MEQFTAIDFDYRARAVSHRDPLRLILPLESPHVCAVFVGVHANVRRIGQAQNGNDPGAHDGRDYATPQESRL